MEESASKNDNSSNNGTNQQPQQKRPAVEIDKDEDQQKEGIKKPSPSRLFGPGQFFGLDRKYFFGI